jgi:ferritin-like metal-binding protein YciE
LIKAGSGFLFGYSGGKRGGTNNMGQSLKARFNGNSQEVAEYARTWGTSKAMEHYEIKDYVAFRSFIKEVTGDELLSTSPLLTQTGGRTWAEDLLDAIENKLLENNTEIQNLQAELKRVNQRLEYYEANHAKVISPKVTSILKMCKA